VCAKAPVPARRLNPARQATGQRPMRSWDATVPEEGESIMPNRQRQPLSTGDALFLYLEREGQPINVGAASVLEGRIRLKECTAFIQSKLPAIPRYLQHVVTPPLNLGPPAWEYDPHFNIRNHVREITLKEGTDAELKAAAGTLLGSAMDRRRPLWDLTLVHGLRGNRTGMIIRIHHCLADGVSGVGLLNAILDTKPVKTRISRGSKPLSVPSPEPESMSALDGVLNSCLTIAKRAWTGGEELLTLSREILGTAMRPGSEGAPASPETMDSTSAPAADALLEIANAAERLPFNVVCRGPRKFHWTEIPLAEIKAVKQACGTTVNDVFLAVVTLAVRRYAQLHRVPLPGRLLRIAVPVNVRGNNDVRELGNRITFLPVAIPLDIDDPCRLLAEVHKRVAFSRGARLAELVSIFGTWLGTIPPALQAILGPLASQLPLSICNLICTNVPGPQQPLYMMGHKLLSCYPHVPIGGEMGMNCAVMTYNGTAFFGFSGDAHAIPDLERLEKFVNDGFKKLRQAAGVPAARTRRSPPAPRPKRSPARVPSPPSKPPASRAASQVGPASAAPEPPAKPKAEPEREPNALSTAAGA